MSALTATVKPTLTKEERRAKREARRTKQRIQNVGRAAKMHAVRLEWERQGELPTLPTVGSALPRINVGCSGWFYWHWRGGFYSADMPTCDWFTHYADHFKTVELNAPFYSWPTPATVRGWVRQVGRRKFVYTVKASELITHVKRFAGTRTLIPARRRCSQVVQRRRRLSARLDYRRMSVRVSTLSSRLLFIRPAKPKRPINPTQPQS
jgi:uncharacterized protein DUF72